MTYKEYTDSGVQPMKYILSVTAAVAVSIALAVLITKRIHALHSSAALRIVSAAAMAAVFLLCFTMIYFSDYYPAEKSAYAALETSAAVSVKKEEGMIFFDGPGTETAMVFYPGAKVESIAYAPLMKHTAELGTDCYLLEPPFHFALFDLNGFERAYKSASYKSWYIAGHSLGGLTASMYAGSHPEKITGLILLGAYPAVKLKDEKLLLVYGSEDAVLNRKGYEDSRVNWPKQSEEHVIPGGTHAGFGNYDGQDSGTSAAVTPDSQQRETAEVIRAFISEE